MRTAVNQVMIMVGTAFVLSSATIGKRGWGQGRVGGRGVLWWSEKKARAGGGEVVMEVLMTAQNGPDGLMGYTTVSACTSALAESLLVMMMTTTVQINSWTTTVL